MRVTLIHNPTAGDEEHSLETLCSLLAAADHRVVTYRSTKEPGWEAALRELAELVVVAGGDGTVQKVFMSIRETGPNVPLAPDADPGDGRLDLVQVRERDRATLAAYVEHRLHGRRPRPPSLPVRPGVRFTITPPTGCPLHVDDELWPEDAAATASATTVTSGESRLELLVPG